MIQRETYRKIVLLGEVGFEQQLGVGVLLIHAVAFLTIVGIEQVHRGITHHGNVRAVLRIEDEGMLHVALIAVCLDTNLVKMMYVRSSMVCLSTLALLLHHADTTVEDVIVALPLPAVLQVPLAYIRLVLETVLVHVVMTELVLIVCQDLGAQLVVQMDVGISIDLQTTLRITKQVDSHALVVIGLQVFDVNLTGDTLVAVTDRRRTFRHLNAVHPRAGNIVQRVRRCGPTEVGQILGQHLNIGAAQSQQLNLLGTCGGVAVVHIDRGVGSETLA